MSRVIVVSAAIVRGDRVLLAQRSPESSYPWSWCTPGGKCAPGETHLDALTRELLEELKVKLSGRLSIEPSPLGRLLANRVYMTTLPPQPGSDVELTVFCYRVEFEDIEGEPRPGDKIVGVGWFSAAEIESLPLAPADASERAALVELARGAR